MKKKTGFVSLLVAGLAWASEPTPENPYAFTSRDPSEAMKKYYASEAKAKAVYEAAEQKARTQLINELTAAQDKLTRSGQLEEALQVKNAVAELQKAPPAVVVAAPEPPNFSGHWRYTRTQTNIVTDMNFAADGNIYREGEREPAGTWKYADNKLQLTWNRTGTVDTFDQVDGNGLVGSNTKGMKLRVERLPRK